ncbi:MAG: thiamine pyrophosphate-dependent enzyme [Chloroflexales bacterium]|nr:thiamine pyrophosphate-dependent enzyme [Chloroflexales bacterium]
MIAQAPEQLVYERPHTLSLCHTHYCPGCTHGVAHRLIAEVIDELGIRENTIGIAPVGCAVFAYNYLECDFAVAAHGRAPAMATGLKRVSPDKVVFTNQGDGDLASIGIAEIIHTAVRGEHITVIFINNAIYGMTGGQMAPTSLVGMKTTSSPLGRDASTTGHPLKTCELISQIDGAAYVVRRSLHNPAEIRKAKKAIRQAFVNQINGVGFSLVELLSSCPTNWGMTPHDALQWIETEMARVFPLGEYKNVQRHS